jgi:hypothetical protein
MSVLAGKRTFMIKTLFMIGEYRSKTNFRFQTEFWEH